MRESILEALKLQTKPEGEDTSPPLANPEDFHHSEERDRALILEADRECAQLGAERSRFELARDKIVFWVGLVISVTAFVVALVVPTHYPRLFPPTVMIAAWIWSLRRGGKH